MNTAISAEDLFNEGHVLTEAIVRSKKLSNPTIYPTDSLIRAGITLVRPFISLRLQHLSKEERADHYYMGSNEFFPEERHYISTPGLHVVSYSIQNRTKGHLVTMRRNIIEVLVRRVPNKKMPLVLRNTWREMPLDELVSEEVVAEQISEFQNGLLFEIARKFRTDYMALFV